MRKFFSKKQKTKNNFQAGFTLVEVMVAMFIFVLIMTMVSSSFGGFLKKYAGSKRAQKATETAQFVMTTMAKTLRTSSNVSIVSDAIKTEIRLFDNSNQTCVVYRYNKAAKQMKYGSAPASDPTSCGSATITVDSDLNSPGTITGFSATGTDLDSVSDSGKITISFKIQEDAADTATSIQSTVSVRNYKKVGASDWIVDSACSGFVAVYGSDVSGTKGYKTTNTACDTPQCGSNGPQDGDKLVSDNSVDFSLYPAREECRKLGGRLPSKAELLCILSGTNQTKYGSNFTGDFYWTSEEKNLANAYQVSKLSDVASTQTKASSLYVRCVK
jgi:prepilin-type N-terminal cleavage/methylation domain-containing protein